MKELRFGSVTLPYGLMLAPMAGVTDTSFRLLCRRFGATYTTTEMISAKALCFEQRGHRKKPLRTAPLAALLEEELPAAVQLFGAEPDYMAEAARMLSEGDYLGATDVRPSAIDINMGCPVPKVVNNGEGSALLRDPDRAVAIVRAVRAATRLPVTVKLRAGFANGERTAPQLAARLEEAGADLICIHGRTRQQMYAPSSDNTVIAEVKRAVSVPVIGNGDIFTAADAMRMLEETGCDGVAVARGAEGNPFLFAEIRAAAEGRAYTPPTAEERLGVALAHAADMAKRKGERQGLAEARRHMLCYCRGLRGANSARVALSHAETLSQISAIFDALLEENR